MSATRRHLQFCRIKVSRTHFRDLCIEDHFAHGKPQLPIPEYSKRVSTLRGDRGTRDWISAGQMCWLCSSPSNLTRNRVANNQNYWVRKSLFHPLELSHRISIGTFANS